MCIRDRARVNGRLGRGGLSAVGHEGEQRGGVALVNVDDRIRLLFGSEYGLHAVSYTHLPSGCWMS